MGIVIRQSIKGTVINYIGAFIGFLITFFVQTKYLSAEDIGLLSVVYEAGMMFAAFAMLGTNSSAIRFFPYFKDEKKKHNGFFFYLMYFPFVGTLIFVPIYLLLYTPISDYFSQNSALFIDYYYWIVPLILFLLYWVVFECYASILLRIAIPKFIREVGLRVLLLILYLLYGFEIIDLNGLIAGYIASYGIGAICCFWYVSKIGTVSLKHDPSFVDKPLRIQALKYIAFLVIGALSGGIVGRLDLFMVSAEMGLDFGGIFRIAFFIAAVIGIPAQSISTIAAPLVADLLVKGNLEEANVLYRKVALNQFIAGSLVFLFIWINIDNIYMIIPNGDEYMIGKWAVFFMALGKVIEVTLSFGGNLVAYSRFYYWGLYFTFFLTAVTILSNNLLIPILGVTGAALATAITTLISYGLQQWLLFVKIKANPYTVGLLKQLGVIAILWSINLLLPTIENPWFDCIYRSMILGILAMVFVYLFKVSEEMNSLIQSLFVRKSK